MAARKAAEINAKLLAKGVPIKQEVLLPKQGHQVIRIHFYLQVNPKTNFYFYDINQ